MEKEGKVDLLSIIILSIVIFLVYVVLVLANLNMGGGVEATFPENNTNASATFGYSPSAGNASFNALTPQFHCTARANTTVGNVTNVSLYIGTAPGGWGDLIENQTVNVSIDAGEESVVIINVTSAFNEGVHWWFCRSTDNGSGVAGTGTANYNTTLNRTFTIDKTGPYLTTNVTNTSNAAVSTEDVVYFAVNFTDQYTSIHTVRLFVNASGAANNEVNITADSSGSLVQAGNDTMVNLSYTIPGHLLDDVLNFTLWVNDSVNNVNMSPAVVLRVDRDATGPGINLTSPVSLFNQSSGTVSFNFTAIDNNKTAGYEFTCGINISLTSSAGNLEFANITNIQVTNGTSQVNSTSDKSVGLSNGTYMWNVSCTDKAGNLNTSLSQNFTIDQIAPVLVNFSINGTGAVDFLGSDSSANPPFEGASRSWAQGRSFTAIGNFTDNLTKLLEADLQFYNTSLGDWQTINTTKDDTSNNITSATSAEAVFNLTFTPPSGRNEFEGNNVSFRLLVNDTLGNMNKSSNIVNITININDTYAPTITINATADGVAMINGSNITSSIPLISWAVAENNKLTSINVSVDGAYKLGTGENTCKTFGYYTSSDVDADNVEARRNSSFQVADTSSCRLSNGTHFINITATDIWGNIRGIGWTFSVDTIGPTIDITPANSTNMTTLSIGIIVTNTDDYSSVPTTTWTSSCGGSGTYVSGTAFYPFNDSSGACTGAAVRTLTITATDQAGNTNTSSFLFGVDNTAPSVTAINPTDGAVIDQVVDGISTLNYSAKDVFGKVSYIGYYLDDDASPTQLNYSESGLGQVNTEFYGNLSSINFTGGDHTLIFTANDSVGNWYNDTVTFVVRAPIPLADWVIGLNATLGTELSIGPVFRVKNDSEEYNDKTDSQLTNETYEILLNVNSTGTPINITLSDLDGSTANWEKINSTYIRTNDSNAYPGIQNNWTNTILHMVYVNNSINEFVENTNSYYGTVTFPINDSLVEEFWWVEDESDLITDTGNRYNISQCGQTGGGDTTFSATRTTPCWNYTSGGRTEIYVPHFSMVVAVNDTQPPTVTINNPATTQRISGFIPNITVSSDAVSCKYDLNITDSTKTSATANVSSSATAGIIGNNNICTWSEIRFKDGVYNITFNVTDASGNLNLSVNRTFTMADSTAPNSGTSISSSPGETSATVTISGVNESVNATVFYGTGNTSFTNSFMQTAFSKSPSVSFTGLTASTVYYYNVTLYDYNGNSVFNSTVFTFTTDAASTTTTTTTTTSSGGGGGAATVSKVADSKAQVWSTVPAGSSFSLDVDKATIAVTSVAVNDVKSELKNVDLEVQALKENPLSTEAAAKVYQYLRINKKNIVDSDAEGFKVSFRVTKAWLTENSLASGDISLYRYKSGWNELVTKVTGTDSTYVNYEADTPGFSSFAVGTKTGVVVEEEVPEGEEVAPGEEAPGEVAPPEEVEAPKAIEAPGKAPVAWLIAAVVIILGIILIVAYQKKKQQV